MIGPTSNPGRAEAPPPGGAGVVGGILRAIFRDAVPVGGAVTPGPGSGRGEFVDRRLGIRHAGPEDGRGEVRLMDRVGEVLGLEAEPLVLPVDDAPFAGERAVQVVAGVELKAR